MQRIKVWKNIYESYLKTQASDFGDFLAQLLKLEIEHREITRKNRSLKAAGFDVIKTFENYEFADVQIPNSIDIENLKNADFVDKKENLILYGPVGTCKTHLATAIGVAACSAEKKSGFSEQRHLLIIKVKQRQKVS